MTTSAKLWIGFGTLTGLLALFCLAIIVQLQSVERRVRAHAEIVTPRSDAAHDMKEDLARLALNLQRFGFLRNPEHRDLSRQLIDSVERDLSEYRRLASNERQQGLSRRFADIWADYRGMAERILAGQPPPVNAADIRRMTELRTSMDSLLDDEMQPDAVAAFNEDIETTFLGVHEIGGIAVVLLCGGVLIAVLTSWIVGRGILRHETQIASLNGDLRRRVEELQTLMQSLPVGVFVANDSACTDISMNKTGAELLRIDASRNASLSGPEADELPFRVLKDGVEIPPSDLPMQRAARTASSVLGEEIDVHFADGGRTSLFNYASPLFDEKGGVRGCLGVLIDITERKRAEAALLDADRRKDEFLATLAHELRNPLAPLRNGMQILKLSERSEGSASRQAVAMMERQLAHMVRLIDDLLDVSRISRGKLALQCESVDLKSALQAAMETNRTLAEAAGLKWSFDLPDQPLVVNGDAIRLAQIFTNLINNAVKYAGPNGVIAVAASVDSAANQALVSVKDRGAGIPPEMLERIFDMFAQVDRGLERGQGGLGIGLTLVKNLVEMHGGRVEAKSEGFGCGSEFVVTLPLDANGVVPKACSDEPAPPCSPSKRRILVADDNLDAAASLAEVLSYLGNEVRTANDGVSALEEAETFRPDVVLMDIGMPRLNGYDACRRLREQPWAREIPMIAITGWGQDEDRRRSREAGFDVHLVKPVAARAISKVIDEIAGPTAAGAN